MGYERNDRSGYGNDRYGRGGYDRRPAGYDRDDRGFFDRAGDEVRSWFGDEEAERRRRYDERYDDRYAPRGGPDRDQYGRGQGFDAARSTGGGDYYGRRDAGVSGYRWSEDRDNGRGDDRQRYATRAGGSASDDSYTSWRDRQMQTLDRDYDDYRRENQSRFESEFSTFRTRRQGQRDQLGTVQEHMDVIGSDGQHVGTVDHVRGDRIQLTKNDQAAGGHHHTIPSSWIASVDDKVTLAKTADEAKRAWREDNESRNDRDGGGLFGGRDDNDWSGRRNLNRSFSGTY